MDELELKQNEMTRELRNARVWLIVVGAIMFVMDMVTLYVLKLPTGLADVPPEYHGLRTKLMLFSVALFAVFLALYFTSRKRPKLSLIVALVVFWGVHLFAMIQDGSTVAQGILIKILFTAALLKGIRSAGRAESLSKELGKVFE